MPILKKQRRLVVIVITGIYLKNYKTNIKKNLLFQEDLGMVKL